MAFLIDDVLLFPVYMTKWISGELQKMAEGERTDEGKVQEELMELQLLYEMEEISEEEYEKKENQLMARLEAIRKYKEKGEQGILRKEKSKDTK